MAKAKDDEEEKSGAGEGAEGGDGHGGEAGGKKSKKKLIIIIVAALVLIGGGVGGFLMMGKKPAEHKEDEESGPAVDEHGNPINKAVYYTLPQFLVNLNATGKSQVFLKTTVVLEVQKATDVPFIESNLPRVVDGINTYLRELRSSDLAGSAGIQRLREEILLRMNKALEPVKINDVLFKEIVVQ